MRHRGNLRPLDLAPKVIISQGSFEASVQQLPTRGVREAHSKKLFSWRNSNSQEPLKKCVCLFKFSL